MIGTMPRSLPAGLWLLRWADGNRGEYFPRILTVVVKFVSFISGGLLFGENFICRDDTFTDVISVVEQSHTLGIKLNVY